MKIKRLIAGLTSLVMLGSLAGCGAKTPDELVGNDGNGGGGDAAVTANNGGGDEDDGGDVDSAADGGNTSSDGSETDRPSADDFADLYNTNLSRR